MLFVDSFVLLGLRSGERGLLRSPRSLEVTPDRESDSSWVTLISSDFTLITRILLSSGVFNVTVSFELDNKTHIIRKIDIKEQFINITKDERKIIYTQIEKINVKLS